MQKWWAAKHLRHLSQRAKRELRFLFVRWHHMFNHIWKYQNRVKNFHNCPLSKQHKLIKIKLTNGNVFHKISHLVFLLRNIFVASYYFCCMHWMKHTKRLIFVSKKCEIPKWMESIVILDMDMIHFDDTIENLQSVQYQAQNQIQIHQVRDSYLWLAGLERNVTVVHRV